ncbi:uncharacterized protein LOC142750375 [Rhinoderma darwinii]|uniref:uncharacterized protein LOC142750375 n=1 Tax=Rhinoderma darwinii TaxID=43563 RepID=UPI003F66CE9C
MTPVKMTPVYNLRNKKAGMPRSSPDPRSRAVKRRLLENKQRKKEKKCKLGKIMEETEPKKKMTEEISHSSDSENDKQKKPLSAKKQKMNKVNATPSNKNLRGKKAELSSEENIDTSSNSDGHEYNKEACEKISSPQIENISDDNASSSSLNPESYTEYDCDRENECSYSSPEQVREDDSASSSSLNHESYEEYDCDREKECSYSSPEQVREDSQIEFREAAFVQEKQVRKNSTLMDISRAQAINEMPEPFNIYNISPISEECIGESKKCLPVP